MEINLWIFILNFLTSWQASSFRLSFFRSNTHELEDTSVHREFQRWRERLDFKWGGLEGP